MLSRCHRCFFILESTSGHSFEQHPQDVVHLVNKTIVAADMNTYYVGTWA